MKYDQLFIGGNGSVPPGSLLIASPWWRHQMETFSALLALCAGNSPVLVNSPHKGQWRGALMFSLICAWINDWVNNREAGDLRRHRGHYDVHVMHCVLHIIMLPILLQGISVFLSCNGTRQIFIHSFHITDHLLTVTVEWWQHFRMLRNGYCLSWVASASATRNGLSRGLPTRKAVIDILSVPNDIYTMVWFRYHAYVFCDVM